MKRLNRLRICQKKLLLNMNENFHRSLRCGHFVLDKSGFVLAIIVVILLYLNVLVVKNILLMKTYKRIKSP